MVSLATLGKEFISDVSLEFLIMAYLANWQLLAILNTKCMRRAVGGGREMVHGILNDKDFACDVIVFS